MSLSYFKAKMHPIRFRLWLRPRLCWPVLRELTALPRPLTAFKGSYTSKGREGTGRRGDGVGRKREKAEKVREERWGKGRERMKGKRDEWKGRKEGRGDGERTDCSHFILSFQKKLGLPMLCIFEVIACHTSFSIFMFLSVLYYLLSMWRIKIKKYPIIIIIIGIWQFCYKLRIVVTSACTWLYMFYSWMNRFSHIAYECTCAWQKFVVHVDISVNYYIFVFIHQR